LANQLNKLSRKRSLVKHLESAVFLDIGLRFAMIIADTFGAANLAANNGTEYLCGLASRTLHWLAKALR
jgi:hypothetical protein